MERCQVTESHDQEVAKSAASKVEEGSQPRRVMASKILRNSYQQLTKCYLLHALFQQLH